MMTLVHISQAPRLRCQPKCHHGSLVKWFVLNCNHSIFQPHACSTGAVTTANTNSRPRKFAKEVPANIIRVISSSCREACSINCSQHKFSPQPNFPAARLTASVAMKGSSYRRPIIAAKHSLISAQRYALAERLAELTAPKVIWQRSSCWYP